MSIAKNWCFTLNNYSDDNISTLDSFPCSYIIYGKEIGESGTPHLQGYVQMEKKIRLTGLTKLLQAHWSIAKGSPEQNVAYCSKDGDVYTRGSIAKKGERSDLEAFKDAVKDGMVSLKRAREEHSEIVARYPRFANEYIRDHVPMATQQLHPLRDWQAALNQKLNLPPSDRIIHFVVDTVGNTGKTWFAKYYSQLHDDVQILESAKKADMAHAINTSTRVLFVNVTRQQQDHFQYSFFEALKDGMVFSPKYESRMRYFKPVHIVVLMNQDPDMKLLSADRYKIVELE